MGRFSENDIFKFLELYKRSECLWNCNHKYYRIKSKRNEAYIRIRDVMNLPSVLEVKQKIKSFRDTYASERTKVRKSAMVSRHSFEVYKPKLRWYNLADSFLNNPEGILKVNCSLTLEDSQAKNRISTSIIPTQRSDIIYSNLQAPTSYRMVNSDPIVNQIQMSQVPTSEPQHHRNFITTQQERQPIFRHIPRNEVLYTQERPEKHLPNKSSEFYHFGMNIAMQLSSLPLVQALNVQTKIQQMICEERIGYEQGRYEIVYDNSQTHSQFARPTESNFLDNPQEELQEESISLESPARDEDDIKVEFFIDDAAAENISSRRDLGTN